MRPRGIESVQGTVHCQHDRVSSSLLSIILSGAINDGVCGVTHRACKMYARDRAMAIGMDAQRLWKLASYPGLKCGRASWRKALDV